MTVWRNATQQSDADQDGVTFEQWLDDLSEQDRRPLTDYLIDADKAKGLRD
jgi:hypothetical protein